VTNRGRTVSCVFATEKCSCIFCIHAIHGNKRSEAISLACGVRCPGIAASLALLAKTVKLEVPLFKFIKRSASDAAISRGLIPGKKDCFALLAMTMIFGKVARLN
jgi:hypothetical protein